jgi:hypothetical protein
MSVQFWLRVKVGGPGGCNSPLQRFQPDETEQAAALVLARFFSSDAMWHFLYFLPLPHQHGSFLPRTSVVSPEMDEKKFFKKPEMNPPVNN